MPKRFAVNLLVLVSCLLLAVISFSSVRSVRFILPVFAQACGGPYQPPCPTNTPIPPTSTPTNTPTPTPTNTPTPTPTNTPTPTPTNTPTPTPTRTPTPTPTATPTPTLTPTPTFYQIYGWVYTEKNNSVSRPEEAGEGLLANYLVNLSGSQARSYTTVGSAISGFLANYIFTPLSNGIYNVALAVTPTGSVLIGNYTNPQVGIPLAGYDVTVDFPFVTVTAVPAPSLTPTVTPSVTPPGITPTPTSVLAATPSPCLALPTPDLQGPSHNICTNVKPTFAAYVRDPNSDNVWARFYSNAFEKFNRMGSIVYPTPGNSNWTPDGSVLNTNGGYWWTAYTESSSCPRSNDAPARLLNMDYTAPPKPQTPSCTFVSQDLVSGNCTFNCSWLADPEPTGVSCSDTKDYFPSFRSFPGGGWEPGWGTDLAKSVVVSDGQLLYPKVKARDNASANGNQSEYSDEGGPYTCPKLNFSATITPGGPTLTPTITPTPTITLTPTITPTPTPGDWTQVQGGDAYQKSYNYPIPAGKYFITDISGGSNSSGIAWSGDSSWNLGLGNISSTGRKAGSTLTNAYNFSYFVESLKNKSAPAITDTSTVGTAAKLNTTNTIYTYSGLGYYTLDTSFTPKTSVTIFIISGSLEITQNFSIPAGYTVVFVVNGNINIGPNVTAIPGLYISSQTFSVAQSSNQLTINGMVYANKFSLNRTYRSFSSPAYQFIYQPQYMIALLPYLGRPQVNWQEVKP